MNKQYILERIDDLSAEQLANSILEKVVTIEELRKTELLDNSKRKAIEKVCKTQELEQQRKKEASDKANDDAWDQVRYEDYETLRIWINENPQNRNLQKAKQQADFLYEEIQKRKRNKQGILAKICRNPNSYPSFEVRQFLDNGTFSEEDLIGCDIPQSAIDNLDQVEAINLELGETPKTIPEDYTEVYFWGSPGSGKTCALGAILHMAEKKGNLTLGSGAGSHYATVLKNIFSDDNIANDFLPAPTPFENTQYLPFTLNRKNERRKRSVSLVELSGEIFKCFYYINGNRPFPSRKHEDTFNSMQDLLKSKNRKIHFFFIDYDRNNQPDGDGIKQSDYLNAASNYFSNSKVFGNTTDAIYMVLTKSDLMHDENEGSIPYEKRQEVAKKYLTENYAAYINTLRDQCKTNSINGGKLLFTTFSLGKVYFKEICNFDGREASKMVEILMDRIKGTRKNLLDVLNK